MTVCISRGATAAAARKVCLMYRSSMEKRDLASVHWALSLRGLNYDLGLFELFIDSYSNGLKRSSSGI